ncbi:hypothetical protein [Synechococcus phage S-B64]|uniref:Uncharacterized protein n=2 Tax=Shandvirus TaxID=2948904 RepID=A0A1Z1LW94_9CAUD|nr:hypothetical protein KNT63_gp051 [Synechococcus phage S-H35]YP_010095382.1 hypothetical protein KNT88_gp144 [Synechococcus phage S-B64]ARW56932.1 hypothetical protein [Synechococcus phage S-H35]AWD90180.1 hypothetical protein [Synechococcus phage S-B64]
MINVEEHEDGSFTISWDENDPEESIFNDWTKEDFINFFKYRLSQDQSEKEYIGKNAEKFGAKSPDPAITEATEEDYEDFWEGDDITEQEIDQDNWYKVKSQEIDRYLKDTNEQTFGKQGYPTKDDRIWEG